LVNTTKGNMGVPRKLLRRGDKPSWLRNKKREGGAAGKLGGTDNGKRRKGKKVPSAPPKDKLRVKEDPLLRTIGKKKIASTCPPVKKKGKIPSDGQKRKIVRGISK